MWELLNYSSQMTLCDCYECVDIQPSKRVNTVRTTEMETQSIFMLIVKHYVSLLKVYFLTVKNRRHMTIT